MTATPQSQGQALLIDTNLLLLLLVGSQAPEHVERFKRTRAYSAADFALLTAYVARFQHLVVTPNVLTEASNLAGQLAEPLRSKVLQVLASVAARADERYFASRDIVVEPDFLRLGLADVSVLMSAREQVAVITDDLSLYLRLSSLGLEVTNFNHVRTGAVDA